MHPQPAPPEQMRVAAPAGPPTAVPGAPLGAVHHPSGPRCLAQPAYGIQFGPAISRFFRKYAVFRGRASRGEYLWVQLFLALIYFAFNVVVAMAIVIVTEVTGKDDASPWVSTAGLIAPLAAFGVPEVALTVRRLHDTRRSGHWAWLLLIPYLGPLIVFIWCCLPTRPHPNQYDI